jgi:hypothetical protein
MADAEKNVCSQSWQGKHGVNITLKNDNAKIVTVGPDTKTKLPWPFSKPANSFSVPAKVGNDPGTYPVTLQTSTGDYGYSTTGCPGDPKEVNPKTVIIT